jgi:putative transposase
MPNTYSALYAHFVFSTKRRKAVLVPAVRERLFAYVGGICRNIECVLVAAGGVEDHVHLLVRRHPSKCESDVMRDIKSNSSRWLKELVPDFAWQDGGGAFSVGPMDLDAVKAYLASQQEHHRHVGFREEFVAFLRKYGIEFEEKYLE